MVHLDAAKYNKTINLLRMINKMTSKDIKWDGKASELYYEQFSNINTCKKKGSLMNEAPAIAGSGKDQMSVALPLHAERSFVFQTYDLQVMMEQLYHHTKAYPQPYFIQAKELHFLNFHLLPHISRVDLPHHFSFL